MSSTIDGLLARLRRVAAWPRPRGLKVDASLAEPPPRSELFSADQMEQHGRYLAESHVLATGPAPDQLLPRLAANEEILLRVFEQLTEAVTAGRIAAGRIDRNLASQWVHAMITTVDQDPNSLILVVADMARSKTPMSSPFVSEFVRGLQGQSSALAMALTWQPAFPRFRRLAHLRRVHERRGPGAARSPRRLLYPDGLRNPRSLPAGDRTNCPSQRAFGAGGCRSRADSRANLPPHWPSFTIHYRYRNTHYRIVVTRLPATDGTPSELMTVVVDGAMQLDAAVPLVDDGRAHTVEISVPSGRTDPPDHR